MVIILNKKDEIIGTLVNDDSQQSKPIIKPKIVEKLNDSYMNFEFSTPADHELAGFLVVENKVAVRDLDGNLLLFRIKLAEDTNEDGNKVRYVQAETEALELLNHWVRPTKLQGQTARQALEYVLSGSRWKAGIVDWAGLRTINFADYETAVAGIHTIRSVFASDLRYRIEVDHSKITNRWVDLLERRGADNGARFEYEKNLLGLVKTESTEDLATALIGIGAQKEDGSYITIGPANSPVGQDWVGDNEALQQWGINGRHITRVFRDMEETDPATLLTKTKKQLQKQKNPVTSFEGKVLLLERLLGYTASDRVRLGDTIRIVDKSYQPALLLEARIIEFEYDPIERSDDDKVVMGDYQPVLSTSYQQLTDLQKIVQSNRGKWDAETNIYTSDIPPENIEPNTLWLDTSGELDILKRWDETLQDWVKASPTTAAEIGAETPQGAQTKAETEAAEAQQNAINTAAGDATTKANQAKTDAINTAAGDATTKANQAKQDAISTAATDATNKANQAKTDAINTAAGDASTKASQAEAAQYAAIKNEIAIQKGNADERYTETYNNAFLTTSTVKTDLLNKKNTYNTSHTNLLNSINTATADGLLNQAEKDDINSKYGTYQIALAQFERALIKAQDDIARGRSATAEKNAKDYADLGFEKKIYKQSARPTGVPTGTLWLNTGEFPQLWRMYDPANAKADINGWVLSSINDLAQMTGLIKETQVANDFIKAPMIGANQVVARHVGAEQITADKLEILAKSFIASPTRTEKTDHWKVYSGAGEFVVEPLADKANRYGMRLTTTDAIGVSHDLVPVDPSQNYKFTAAMKSSSDIGSIYFGLYAYDKAGNQLSVMQFDVASRSYTTETNNPYFWYGDSTDVWRYMEGYVMGSEATASQIPTGLNVDRHFVLPAAAAFVTVRFLNYYNSGTSTNAYIFDPSITRIDAGIISFDQAKGGELSLGGDNSKNGILSVKDPSGQEVARLDGSYGGFTELGIDVLKNTQNILFTTYDGLHNFDENVNKFYFYVDPQYGDDNNDGTEAFPTASLQTVIDRLPKVLNHHVLIYVRPGPLYYDDVIFVNGFMGTGSLTIDVWPLQTRYVHFQSNGNNKNTGNHYNEIKVWTSDGSNRANGAGAAGRILPHGTTAIVSNADKITNGITSYGDYGEISGGLNTFQMYLGGIYTGIAHVHRWMYYNDARYYKNTKIMFSDQTWDNVNYKPYVIYDQDYEGTYTETSEGLIVPGNRYKLIGRFAANNNTCYLSIKNMVVDARKLPEANPFYFSKCIHAYVGDSVLWCNPNNTSSYGYGMYSNNGSYVRCVDCEVNNAVNSAFLAAYGGNLEVVSSKGSNNACNFYAFGTSYIGGGGTQPKLKSGTSYSKSSEYGQVFLDAAKDTYHVPTAGTYSPIAAPAAPPAPDPVEPIKTTYVETFTSSGNCDSYDETNDGSISYGWRRDSSDVRQGKWDVWGNYRGCFFFGSNISNKVNGTTVKKVEVWLQRQSSGGSSSAVSVGIRAHNYASRPSGQPATAGVQNSSFSLSQSKWVDCTSALKSYFASGYKGICLYTGTTSQYARMVNKCSVRITYEK